MRADQDDDGSNDSATLSHTASGADYGSVTEDLPVTVTDDDSAGIVLTPTTLRVTEGGSATYTVELATEPSGQVTVTVGGAPGTDLTVVNGGSLTFTDSTWNTAQTVEVRAGEDDDGSDDSATLSHTASGADYGSVTEDLPVTVTDDDSAGIVLTPTTLRVTEGGSATYTVELATEPSGQVTVTVGGASGTDLTVVSGGSLTFTASTWNTAQTVEVRAGEDDDGSNDSETLSHTASGGGYGSVTEDLPVTVTDNDTAGIVLTPTTLRVTEGESETYTVELATEPSGEVTVTVGGASGTDLIVVNGGSLTFTDSTWNTAQTVEVRAGEDDDGSNDSETLNHTASGGGYGSVTEDLPVTVTDNDTAGIVLTPTTLRVTEGGSTTYTVELATEPSGEVTVIVGGASGTDLTVVSGGSLTFRASTWNTAQTVEVRAGEDDDGTNDSATLSHTASGGGYGSVTEDLPVTVTDDDTAAIVLTPTTLRVTEGGSTTYTVELATEPSGEVTVTVGGASGTDLIVVNGGSLTFTASTWNTAQTVEVRADEDDDGTDDSATLTHTASGGDYGSVTKDLPVTVTDNDAAGIVLSPPALGVTEGESATYTVELSTQPSGQVTVTVGGATGTDLTVVKSSLTFTATDWNTTQTVEVSADEDDDASNDSATLTHTAAGADYGSVTKALPVTVTDNDAAGIVLSPPALGVTEGESESYTVELSTEPSGQVTVTVGGATGTELTVVNPSLTFTATDWNTTQTVEVSADEDDDGSNDSATLSHTASGGGYGSVTEDLPVTVTDNDTAGIVLTPTTLRVTEGGSATYTVELSTEPSGEVRVTVGGATGTDLTVVKSSLTFTATDWNTTQTVEVSADEDDDASDDSATLTHAAAGADYGSVTRDLPVTVTDNDTAGIVLSPTELQVTEGSSATYTVELVTEPSGEVTVTVGGATGTDLTVVNPSLTFTATDWNTTQTVEVSADEDDDASNDSATLTHTAAGADYGSVTNNLPVTVTDNDTASTGIGLSLNPDSISEGGGATAIAVTAALDGAAQTVPTEVTVAVADDTATAGTDFAAVAGVTLTIAAGATSGAATFTLTPIDDEIAEEDETLEVSGTVTAGTTLPVSSAKLTLTDDDEPALTVAFAEDLYTVDEGATVEVEVTLSRDPGSTMTIPLTATAGSGLAESDYTGVPASIAFNAGETGKSFTVTAHQDRVAEASETVTLGFGPLPEGVSEGSRASTQVSIADDDTRRVAVAPTELELAEGESGSYTVVLESQPTGAVTVTVAAPAEAQFTVDETVLTFAAESWETARTVTVTAAVDANAATPPPATLTHGVSGADYEGMAADSVTVSIPEAVSAMGHELTLAVAPAEVTESAGSTRITVTGTLNTALSQEAAVTVAVTGETAAATDFAAAAPVTLTIAAGQSIGTASFTLTPVDDALDEANETLKVSGTTPLPELTVIPATLTIIDDDAPPPVPPKAPPPVLPKAPPPVLPKAPPPVLPKAPPPVLPKAPPPVLPKAPPPVLPKAPPPVLPKAPPPVLPKAPPPVLPKAPPPVLPKAPPPVLPKAPPPVPPAVSIVADATSVAEGRPARFTVTRTGDTADPLVVTVGVTQRGSFIAGAPPTRVTLPAKARTATLRVATEDDTTDEPDGAVIATLTAGGAGYVPVHPASASVTIRDDDAAPELRIGDESAVESAGQLVFSVELSAASARQVTVSYATVAGTATEDADYTATSGALTFAPGRPLAQTIAVPILDDTLDETDETFALLLNGARHATLAGAGATLVAAGTIEDDDEPAVSIVADAGSVAEGSAARFTVTRHGIGAEPLSVVVAVTETGSVIAGELPAEVTIAANARTATLLVATEDDATDEPDGAVTAAVVAGAGYVTGEPESATVTVTDDDAAPELTIADVRAVESTGAIEFTVRLAAASGHEVMVSCTSADGTATADEDYIPEDGALTLAPGQTSATIRIGLLDDIVDEADETFTMVLADAVNARLVDGIAVGTIEDDDVAVAQAWLTRFGRTVATHVMEAIDGRLAEGMGPGAQASVAGRRLQPAADLARAAGTEAVPVRRLEFRELLAGSSFHLALSAAEESAHESGVGTGERWTAWGRGAATQLAGVEGKLSLGGQVVSGVVGADYDWGRMVTGLSVAYSDGGGGFTVRGSGTQQERTGDLQSWLLSAHPYASVKLTDRLEVWGLLGYGLGRMSLAEDGAAVETDIRLLMGAFAGRGVLLSRAQNGVELTLKSDGLVLQVSGEEAAGLPAVTADVQRVRLVLEGALDVLRGPAGVLTPSLQVGARYDGGAAETGAGLEAGRRSELRLSGVGPDAGGERAAAGDA